MVDRSELAGSLTEYHRLRSLTGEGKPLPSREIETIRAALLEGWRSFVNDHGGLDEHGMPLHPEMLPGNMVSDWCDILCFWNKEWARAKSNEERDEEDQV